MADSKAIAHKVTTGKVRFSFTKGLFEPEIKHGKEVYSMLVLVPKSDKDGVAKIKAAIEACKTDPASVAVWGGKYLASMKTGLRDGDTERDTDERPEYKGHYFINVNTYNKPGIVDAQLNPVLDRSEIYSGCYGRVSLVAKAYNQDGNKGIKFYLNNVQKLADGEPLAGGSSRPEDDFSAVTDDFLA